MNKKNNPEEYNFVFDDNGWKNNAAVEYQKRRSEYLIKNSNKNNIKANSKTNLKNSPLLLWGVQNSPLSDFHFSADFATLYQESHILYFTGIKQQKVALWLNPLAKKKEQQILFLPTKDSHLEFWQGNMLGISENKEWNSFQKNLIGFTNIQDINDIEEIINEQIKNYSLKEISLFWHASENKKKVKKDHQYFLNENLKKKISKKNPKIKFSNQYQLITDMRNYLDLQEKKNLRNAIKTTKDAFFGLLKKKSKMTNEKEVANFLREEMVHKSGFPLHYSLIVGGGINATCLHYVKNNEKIKADELVLIDFGVKHHHIGCDVTRTFPLAKRMNPLQAILYQIVLDTNKAVEKIVEKKIKAGISFQELNDFAWQYLEDELQKRFVDKGGKMKRAYQKAPHGIGHLLGYEVHDGDAFGEYKERPLQEGWVITNEPGLYGEFEIIINKKKYKQSIGIRIEDNLLITKNGCQNLTKDIPKEIVELEKI